MERISTRLASSRVASILTVALGIWVMLSPIWLAMTGGALTSVLISGGVLIVLGLTQIFWENSLPSWLNVVASIWLFITAFLFLMGINASWSTALAGIVGFILSVWDGSEMSEVQRLHQQQSLM